MNNESGTTGLGLELRVVETSPHPIVMAIRAPTTMTVEGDSVKKIQAAYFRGKTLLGVVAGSEEQRSVLTFSTHDLQGVVALVDGGYDDVEQISPERKMELITIENKPLTVGTWVLPRQKHERPLRIEMITGVLKALLAE
jgi:DNA polymerase III sliding clamp (beta) subunit (PCNA family)